MLKPEQLFKLPVDRQRIKERDKPKSTRKQMEAFRDKHESMTNKKTFK
tara:strand:- start:217 stop:360 length:144 start_codon:yes stop_codon:yes gene_type:complete